MYPHFIEVIHHGYSRAIFFAEGDDGGSEIKAQKTAFDKSASPYLFVLVMPVIDRDVARKLKQSTEHARYDNIDFDRT